MHERVSGLRNSGVYFFRGDFEHVLHGVVLDYTPRGVYIEEFRFPLFDFAGPNLLYSDRLREGAYIEKGTMSEGAIVDLVMGRSEVQSAFGEMGSMSLPQFVEYLLGSDALLNSHAQLIQAAALVLLDRGSQAVTLLHEIRPSLHPSDVSHWEAFHQSLEDGPEAAESFLKRVREKNLAVLGVV